ncbi:MAG: helix-turn-helix transcriptional regulator [Rhizobacter sp.]|nr:helix-turn-helix transcriptional regulator [Ferruginibacter sp.]
MKLRPYAFKADPMYAYMEKLSVDLNVTLHNDITLKLPPEKGSGFIKNIFLEDDFCIRYYHFHLNQSMPFHWCYDTEADELLYKLMFTCGSTPVAMDKNLDSPDPQSFTQNSSVLYPVDSETVQIIPANIRITRIALMFTKEWLEQNFPDASYKITEIVDLLGKKHRPSFIPARMGYSYYATVNEMAKEMDNDIFPVIHIKTKSLVLLNEFLNKVVETSEANSFDQKSLYSETIIKVEQRLQKFLLTSMPSIAQLSAEFNMSPSTLQRHFKIIYGKNIYHYYLEQKLAIGKELIASKKKTISEVAYILGYHKINSFSKVFKKYFGVLPKDINALNKINAKK